MQTIISLVSAGMGMALVPCSLLRNLARTGVRYLALEGPVPEVETWPGLAARRSAARGRRFVEMAARGPDAASAEFVPAMEQ